LLDGVQPSVYCFTKIPQPSFSLLKSKFCCHIDQLTKNPTLPQGAEISASKVIIRSRNLSLSIINFFSKLNC
jgi:hypothetical protein